MKKETASEKTGFDRALVILLVIAAGAGAALIYVSTVLGPGVGGDATIYMTAARNLAAGKGLGLIEPDGSFRLLPYSAPFFPLVLTVCEFLGLSLSAAARGLNIWLFAMLVLMAGGSLWLATRSRLLAFAGALLVAVSPILTPVFSWAMAEPLTLALGFGGLLLMAALVEDPKHDVLLVFSALLTGLAFLTRYSGAAFVAAAGLGWLVFARLAWKSRLVRGAVFGVIALVPMGAWVLAQVSFTSGVASRSMEDAAGMAGRLAAFWPQAGDVILSWLLPASWIEAPFYPRLVNTLLTLAFIIVLIALAFAYFRQSGFISGREGRPQGPRPTGETPHLPAGVKYSFADTWPVMVGCFILMYLAELFVVYLTTYPPITLDNRMFSPVHVGVLMLLPIFLNRLVFSQRGTLLRFAPLAVVLALAAWYGWRDVRIVSQNYAEGLGYNSKTWRTSELVGWVKQAPPDTTIVTNETMALLYLTGRTAYPLAEVYADRPGDVDARYGSAPADEGQRLFERGDVPLVLFDTIDAQFASIYGDQTARRVEALTKGLKKAFQGSDGAVYYAPK